MMLKMEWTKVLPNTTALTKFCVHKLFLLEDISGYSQVDWLRFYAVPTKNLCRYIIISSKNFQVYGINSD